MDDVMKEFLADAIQRLKINEGQLETHLTTCASYAFTAGCTASEAEMEYEHAVKQREQREANLTQEAMKNGKKGITMSEIKLLFRLDKKWDELKDKELERYMNHKQLSKLAAAFELQGKMLMSINRRQLFKIEKGIKDHEG